MGALGRSNLKGQRGQKMCACLGGGDGGLVKAKGFGRWVARLVTAPLDGLHTQGCGDWFPQLQLLRLQPPHLHKPDSG
jgi:hypothetical protein